MKVFITDAENKHTLAAVRSLGKKGVYTIAGSSIKHAQSFYSKYCKERVVYPNPKNGEKFVNYLLNFLKESEIDVLLPIGYTVTTILSKFKNNFSPYVGIPIANYEVMKIASDKNETIKLAQSIGIKTPKTIFVDEQKVVNESDLNFPVVIKGVVESGHICYANSYKELLTKLENNQNSLLQEYIPGEGYGFFGLFNHGEPRAIFMHKRIREYPITGGPSTVAESIYDPKLKNAGLKILKELNWHGVAMVEFKKDSRDGEFKLMEINPKFWGSLDLAIASGVDFPYLACKMAVEGDVEPVFEYETGVRFRWLLPDDFLHLLASPSSAKDFFGDFFDKNVKHNIWLSDIKPNLFQIAQTGFRVISLIRDKKLKYPHGKPEEVS